jgi:protein-disulfide isomerase
MRVSDISTLRLAGCVAALAVSLGPPVTAQAPLEVRAKGSPQAPVTVVELSDFQCPWCRRFTLETLPFLEREYITPGKVRFVFVNFPLTEIHRNAAAAHETAMCAARQGKFWPMHDLLFRKQEEWGPLDQPGPSLIGYADSIGADREALSRCLETGATRADVAADARSAFRTGANSTPTFLIEGGMLPGAHGIEVWRTILDSILRGRERGTP